MATANDFKFADYITMTALDELTNTRAVSQFFNTDYSSQFKLKFPIGDSVRVPYPQRFTVARGLPYQPQATKTLQTTITFLEPFQIGFDWDSAEAALKAPRGRETFRKRFIKPAMSYARQSIDDACAQYAYQNAASVVGVLGTAPSSYDSFSAAAKQKMDELGCPVAGDRAFIIPPAVNRALKASAVSYFNPVTQLAKTWRTGLVGEADGFEFYNTMSLYRHTAGTWAGAVTVTTTSVDGATSLVVTCTTGDTFKQGDKFSVASSLPVNPMTRRTFGTDAKTFTITADATGASSTATLSISPAVYGPLSQYQNVSQHLTAGSALTLWPGTSSPNGKSGTISLALHRDAFALAGVELEEPKTGSVELVSQMRDPDSGISMRFIREWDGQLSRFINRFDWMIGLGTFYNDACAVAAAGA